MKRHTNKHYTTLERRITFKQRQVRTISLQFQEEDAKQILEGTDIEKTSPHFIIDKDQIYQREVSDQMCVFGDFPEEIRSHILSVWLSDDDATILQSTAVIFIPPSPISYLVCFLDDQDAIIQKVHVIAENVGSMNRDIFGSWCKTMDQMPPAWNAYMDTNTIPSSTFYVVCDAKQLHSSNILITLNEMGEMIHAEYVPL